MTADGESFESRSDNFNAQTAMVRLQAKDVQGYQFKILKLLSSMQGTPQDRLAHELLIRVMDNAESFRNFQPMVAELLRMQGLYPYLPLFWSTERPMSMGEILSYEAHRPLDYDRDIVFHRIQAEVYIRIMSGENVILSAPTSFGKSLIIDAVAASGRFSNIAVIVPTIALIDETRRRMARLDSQYKMITHPGQEFSDRNLLILTQERLLDLPALPPIKLFMIDEFYKLDLTTSPEADRSSLLNQALYQLLATGAQFYLAGPKIAALADTVPSDFRAHFVSTDFATVTTNVTVLPRPAKNQELSALVELCRSLDGPTLIYCSNPDKTRAVAEALVAGDLGKRGDLSNNGATPLEAAHWISRLYHRDWVVAKALRSGIGVHHGKLPRSLAQYQVSAFNEGLLSHLVCTSTLIEGVNTAAKNVILFDHILNRRALDYFTYSNIRGRSGRMNRHFVGEVFVFREPPSGDLLTVDIPVITQPIDTPKSLLIQMKPEDMTAESWDRIRYLHDQSEVPIERLRENNGVDPDQQIELARYVRENARRLAPNLAWAGYPTYDQLKLACELIVSYLKPVRGRVSGVSSASQLAFRINQLSVVDGDVKRLIDSELARGPLTPDQAVENVLEFVRYWPGFHFPRLLGTLHSLVKPILDQVGFQCDYTFYAGQAQALFLPLGISEIEEFGIPSQAALRLLPLIGDYQDLDELLLKVIQNGDSDSLFSFEKHQILGWKTAL